MHRVRLASLLAVVMALSGAWAMPARSIESTRLVTSIAWFADDERQTERRPENESRLPETERVPAIGEPTSAAHRATPLPYALYQRPPPPVRS